MKKIILNIPIDNTTEPKTTQVAGYLLDNNIVISKALNRIGWKLTEYRTGRCLSNQVVKTRDEALKLLSGLMETFMERGQNFGEEIEKCVKRFNIINQ
jgi:hypothetical protein